MKSQELENLKPVYIHEGNFSSDNEISLVDLAKILVRRKTIIFSIFSIVVIAGVAVALLMPKKYTYSTSIEIGSQIINGTAQPFESPETLLAKLDHSFIPNSIHDLHISQQQHDNRYRVKASVPKNSEIIILSIDGTESQNNILIKLLRKISEKAIQDHGRIYEAVKQNYTTSINQAKTELSALTPNSIEQLKEIQNLKNTIESYNSRLVNLRNTREISPAMKSLEPTGASKKMIAIIITVLAISLSVFTAFFAEFISKVKEPD